MRHHILDISPRSEEWTMNNREARIFRANSSTTTTACQRPYVPVASDKNPDGNPRSNNGTKMEILQRSGNALVGGPPQAIVDPLSNKRTQASRWGSSRSHGLSPIILQRTPHPTSFSPVQVSQVQPTVKILKNHQEPSRTIKDLFYSRCVH